MVQARGEHRKIRIGRQVFEQDFLGALSIEGDRAGEHFVEDDPHRIDVNLLAVFPLADLRGHVVKGSDAFGLASATRSADVLRKPVVADFGQALFEKNIRRL